MRFLEKPGTASLTPYLQLLPEIASREPALAVLADGELAAAAREATDDAGICAVGREAARRGLGERPFDVQLLGTLALLTGHVAEMATGEGKTLSGALAAAGYALRGPAGPRDVGQRLPGPPRRRVDAPGATTCSGVTVGWVSSGVQRRPSGARPMPPTSTYGSVSEVGFDVLRDRLSRPSMTGLVTGEPDVVARSTRPTRCWSTRRWCRWCSRALSTAIEAGAGAWPTSSGGCGPDCDYEIDEDGPQCPPDRRGGPGR